MSAETLTQDQVRKLLSGGHVPRQPARQGWVKPAALTIIVPVPPKPTHPNARPHWKTKLRATKKQRTDAANAAAIVLRCEHLTAPLWKHAEVQATFYLPRTHDSSNLAGWLKASLDGLEDAEIIENDSGLTVLPPIQITAAAAKGRREVVLELKQRT